MHSGHIRIWGAVELAKAERQVAITSALVELQRCFIDHLFQKGEDIDSEMAVYDSLQVGLARSVNYRHQLLFSLKHTAAA